MTCFQRERARNSQKDRKIGMQRLHWQSRGFLLRRHWTLFEQETLPFREPTGYQSLPHYSIQVCLYNQIKNLPQKEPHFLRMRALSPVKEPKKRPISVYRDYLD